MPTSTACFAIICDATLLPPEALLTADEATPEHSTDGCVFRENAEGLPRGTHPDTPLRVMLLELRSPPRKKKHFGLFRMPSLQG